MRFRVVGVFLVASLCGACDAPEAGADETQELRKTLKNGPTLNGSGLNGVTLNGITLNGITLNGITLNGVTLNGITLNGVTLNGSQFSGWQTIDGVDVERVGVDFIGAEFRVAHGGQVYTLKFADIYKDPADPDGDVYFHDITVHDPKDDSWTSLCEKGGQPMSAIAIPNHWDPETGDRIETSTAVTFACRGFVLAKCVELGYRPWATGTHCDDQQQNCAQVSLADYHQSCTRMLRADYCGDGTSHTIDGTLIDMYDSLSPHVQARTTEGLPHWGVEAEWGPDGALCVGDTLRLQLLDELGIQYKDPYCFADIAELPACGTLPADRGAMLGNSYCSAWGSEPGACM